MVFKETAQIIQRVLYRHQCSSFKILTLYVLSRIPDQDPNPLKNQQIICVATILNHLLFHI
ncbi:hypothetical protein D3C71_1377290 [compost metagenome]